MTTPLSEPPVSGDDDDEATLPKPDTEYELRKLTLTFGEPTDVAPINATPFMGTDCETTD